MSGRIVDKRFKGNGSSPVGFQAIQEVLGLSKMQHIGKNVKNKRPEHSSRPVLLMFSE